jgi:hypothetical protein
MTPEQRANAEELYNELRKFAEPPNDPFENMPIEKVNEYLRQHGYDPDQVGLRGQILGEALIENVDLRAQVAALQTALDEIRLIARSVLPSEEIISDHQAHWNGKELYQIAKKAESALKGEVKE